MAFVAKFAENVRQLAGVPVPAIRDTPVEAEWPRLAAAVDRALTRGETHYTDRPGILALRERVAALLSTRFGLEVDPRAAVVITCGGIEARFVALQQLVQPGEAVWAPESLVAEVEGAALIRRATISAVPESARLVYLANSLGEAALRVALDAIPAEALVLFEVDDETDSCHPAHWDGFADRTVTVGSIGYAAWQMGYLAAPAKHSAGLRDFKQALTICSTNLSQWAALAAMGAV